MTDSKKANPKGATPHPKQSNKDDEKLARELRDSDMSSEEYESLTEDLKERRRRVDGSGDSLFDDIEEES